jgi:hypothetical protein
MFAHGAHIPGEGVTADRLNLIPSPGSRASARSDLSLWALWERRGAHAARPHHNQYGRDLL